MECLSRRGFIAWSSSGCSDHLLKLRGVLFGEHSLHPGGLGSFGGLFSVLGDVSSPCTLKGCGVEELVSC